MKNRLNLKKKMIITLTAYVFIVSLVSTMVVMAVLLFMLRLGLFAFQQGWHQIVPIIIVAVPMIILATIMAAVFSKRPLRPMEELIKAIDEVSKGNFDVRLDPEDTPVLSNVYQSFNKMTEELRTIETLRKDFITNFSHEFKTPIVSLKGFAKLLKKDNLSKEERDEYLDIIVDESQRLSQLATNTLNLTKLESQITLIEKSKFRLDEQIRQCLVMLEGRWTRKNIELNVSLDEINIEGNENLLQQVWLNLLDNAVKFTSENGEIVVSLRRAEDKAVVVISDNGIGMDKETVDRIFDKYYQGDKSRGVEGNGLGRPITKHIIFLHEGSISVESRKGKGSAFTLVLPLKTENNGGIKQ